MKSYLIFCFYSFLPLISFSQSTYSKVYSIFQANCAVACHTTSNPSGNLILNDGEIEVYSRIVNAVPTNPEAALNDKLIFPGHPERSFLFRKCNNNWDSFYPALRAGEGNSMPSAQKKLTNFEMETIRQWILFGAPENGVVVADSTLINYYGGKGLKKINPPPPLSPSEGVQIRLGPFFMNPRSEIQYAKKHPALFDDNMEVNRVEVFMNQTSHHFVAGLIDPAAYSATDPGLRIDYIDFSRIIISTQYSNDFQLPAGAAYSIPFSTALDMTYHMVNYSLDSVLQADVYLNLYNQPVGTAEAIMVCKQIDYRSEIKIPNNTQNVFLSDSIYIKNSTDRWNIWMISSHTHQWGKDYDIFLRNSDGSKGRQVYEGFFNTDYSFNQGYYDWAHPAVRFFEPLETINISNGLIHEAKFRNFGADTAVYGPDADNEMMSVIVQYTVNWDKPSSLPGKEPVESIVNVFPNPFYDEIEVEYLLQKEMNVQLELFNILGQRIISFSLYMSPGNNLEKLDFKNLDLITGIYILKIKTTKGHSSKKLIKL